MSFRKTASHNAVPISPMFRDLLAGEQVNDSAGLVGTHAYSILDARELGLIPGLNLGAGLLGQTRLIKLRNPWVRLTDLGRVFSFLCRFQDRFASLCLCAREGEHFADCRFIVSSRREAATSLSTLSSSTFTFTLNMQSSGTNGPQFW